MEFLKKYVLNVSGITALAVIVIIVLQVVKSGSGKIAYIETNVLLQKYEGFKKAQAEYQKKAAVWKANSDTLVKSWEAELKKYEKERAGMSAKERELKEQLLGNKQQQISNYREAMQKKSKDEEQNMMQTVYNEVNDFVSKYGKSKGYKYVLGANGTGNILYADQAENITDKVLEGLNSYYQSQNK